MGQYMMVENDSKLQASKLLLRPQTSGWVCHFDAQNLCPETENQSMGLLGTLGAANTPFQDNSPVAAAHVVSDLSSVLPIVHQQQVDLPDVVDQELLQTIGEEVSCL